jgi:hypothetical protein
MTDLITLPRATAQHALEALKYSTPIPQNKLGHELAITALKAALEQPEQTNPWRDAVDHELSTLHMVASNDPRESIRRLIDWHCAVQINPLVSSAAQELIERGKREALEQDTDCHTQGICQRSGYGIGQPEHDPLSADETEIVAKAMRRLREQEPVAWMVTDKDGRHFIFRINKPVISEGETLAPLYTHPPSREWRGLSEEEIRHFAWNGFLMAEGIWDKDTEEDLLTFARAIEAALRSKNYE